MKESNALFLDTSKIDTFRAKVNETSIFVESKENKNWNLICVVMDRLDSSSKYLNSLIVDTEESFIIFLVFGDIIINCIQELCKNLGVNYYLKDDSSCFKEIGIKGNVVEDDKFFSYVRALAFAHCENCSKHRSFIQVNEIQYSPFVIPFGFPDKGKCGLRIYSSLNVNSITDKLFYFKDLREYIKKRFDLLSLCEVKVEEIIDDYKKKWMESIIYFDKSKPKSAAVEIEKIGKERYQDNIKLLGLQISEYLNIESSDDRNNVFVSIYKSKIIEALPQIIDALNTVDNDAIENALIWEIINPSYKQLYKEMTYDLSKIFDYLEANKQTGKFEPSMLLSEPNCNSNLAWGYKRLESFKTNISDKYIYIDYNMPINEILFLINCFLFLLNNDLIKPIFDS